MPQTLNQYEVYKKTELHECARFWHKTIPLCLLTTNWDSVMIESSPLNLISPDEHDDAEP